MTQKLFRKKTLGKNECKHKWIKAMEFRSFFGLFKSSYSVCEKCRLIRHDNDKEMFRA